MAVYKETHAVFYLYPLLTLVIIYGLLVDFLDRYKHRYDHTKNFLLVFLENLDKYLLGLKIWNSSNF